MPPAAPAEAARARPSCAGPLPSGVSAEDVAVQCLLHTADRELAGIHAVLVGLCFMLVVHWGEPTLRWVAISAGLRFVVLLHQLWVTRRIARIGAVQALAERLDRRLVWGLATGGAAWGLLAWAIGPMGQWTLRDELTIMMLLVSAPLTLITTSYLWQGMLAFNAGLWGQVFLRVATEGHTRDALLVMVSLGFLLVVLYLYGRQLHRQTRAGVVANLHSQSLSGELGLANSQLTQALGQALALATHDPLTQALNRRAFLDRTNVEASAMQRHGHAACLLMLDLDKFKSINDTHGHAAGDEVLMACASAIQTVLRGADVLARWGGEEFIVLLPQTQAADALSVAERMREVLQALQPAHWPAGVRVTASIGLATWPPGLAVDVAIRLADAALYAAKAGGRNQVRTAEAQVG